MIINDIWLSRWDQVDDYKTSCFVDCTNLKKYFKATTTWWRFQSNAVN